MVAALGEKIMASKGRTDAAIARTREQLAKDVEAFLKSGKKIKHIPMGVSGQSATSGGRKQLVLKPRRA